MTRVFAYATVLTALVLGVPLASGEAADQPAAPTIDSAPPNPSGNNGATFAFSDADLLVTLQCRIDGAAFALCLSPTSYSGLRDGSHTFDVKAVDLLLNESVVTSYTWTVDTTPPPAPTITSQPQDPANDSSPTFQFTDADGTATLQCRLDGAGFSPCSSPKTFTGVGDGSHAFDVKAVDPVGNESSVSSYAWTIDTVAPTVTLTGKPPNPSNDPTPGFAFSASEATPGGFECGLDSGVFGACTSPMTLPTTADGSHTFTVRATDAAGNTGSTSYTWTIDTVAPTATLTLKPPNPSKVSTPSFSFSASETSTFECRLDAGAFAACSSPTTLGSTPDGSHTFFVRATDAAKNTGAANSYTWTIDTTPPPAPRIDPASKPRNPTNQTGASFVFSDTEAGVSFQCRLDAVGGFLPCTSPKSYSGLAIGSHTFRVKALDAAGNESSVTPYTWTIDTLPPSTPTIDPASKPHDPTNQTGASFVFSDTEAGVSFQCSLGTAAFTPCTSPKSYLALADGSHTFRVKALDAAANESAAASYTWTIDATPPTITFSTTPPNLSNDSTPTFAFSSSEAAPGGFQCRLDSGLFAPCTSPTTLGTTPDGPRTFTVRAADPLGNTGSASYAWTIDATPPVLSLTSKPPSPSGVATAHFEFSAADQTNVTLQCQLDAQPVQSCTSPKDYSGLSNAAHTFTLKGTDAAGNSSTTSYSWLVDTVNPVVTITQKPPDPSNQASPSFTFSSNKAPSTFQCQLDGAGFSSCTSPKAYGPVAAGPHSFQVKATDLLNHTGPVTEYKWTIDLTPPSAPAIGGRPANPTNATGASFVFSDSEAGLTFGCSLDGGAFSPCTSPKSLAGLANGTHTFAVRATDPAGNIGASATYAWAVDTAAPETRITAQPLGSNGSASATFGFTSSEAGSSFACSLDGSAYASCSSPQAFGALANGTHTFRVRATDAAGNTDPTPAVDSWQVAVIAPVDWTPPANVSGVKRRVGYGRLQLAWGMPPDPDFDHVRVLVSTRAKRGTGTIVYSGRATRYKNTHFKNGTYYRYTIVTYDRAGNASRGVAVMVPASSLLRTPRQGSVVHAPPRFVWDAVPRATYYNMQLYRGNQKVLSAWPKKAKVQLGRQWRYSGRTFRLKTGVYHWYVWPAFGPRAKGRYGQLLGQATFTVR